MPGGGGPANALSMEGVAQLSRPERSVSTCRALTGRRQGKHRRAIASLLPVELGSLRPERAGDPRADGFMEAAQHALDRGLLGPPDFVQIPHQGSRRNVTPGVLNAWLGQPNGGATRRGTAMVMVGAKKDEHPRNKVKNAFIRRGYPVFVGRTGWMRMPYGYELRGVNITAEPFSYDVEDD